jgi:hypothetical protein
MQTDSENTKCDGNKVDVNTWLSRVSYCKVIGTANNNTSVVVENTDGFSWNIGRDIVSNEMYSADEVRETKDVTRSELVKIFTEETRESVFTVCFTKKATADDILEVMAIFDKESKGKKVSPIRRKQIAKMCLECGAERILKGYMLQIEPSLGRSNVYDLEVPRGQHGIRQVDHRTIKWLILRNVKYEVKK